MIIGTNIRVTGPGNLSLGQGGYDDNQADATAKYAKADCRYDLMQDLLNRPLADALPTTSLTESRTRTSAGIWNRLYTFGGTVTPKVRFILPEVIRSGVGGLAPASNQAYALHGYKVTSIDFNYAVTTLAATSLIWTAQTETAQTNNTARANASVTPLGAVTYQNPIGTVVATLPVATQASPYVTRVVFGTPVFLPTDNLTFELGFSADNTCVVTITGLWINYSLAIY